MHRKKDKDKRRAKKEQKKDDQRCEEVAQLLLAGRKGSDLENVVRQLDAVREFKPTPGPSAPVQFTFVQGLPNMPNPPPLPMPPQGMSLPAGAFPMSLMHRRSSSAPPADQFIFGAEDAATPTAHCFSASSTPIVRPIPLEEHDDDDEYRPTSIRRSAAKNGKQPKSSLTKAAKARGGNRPPRRRGDEFVQSVWTTQAIADQAAKDQASGEIGTPSMTDSPSPPPSSFYSNSTYPRSTTPQYSQYQFDPSQKAFAPFDTASASGPGYEGVHHYAPFDMQFSQSINDPNTRPNHYVDVSPSRSSFRMSP